MTSHSDLRKAAEMAIEAIMKGGAKEQAEAVYALRQALAQPEQSKTYAAEDITAVVEAMVTAFKLRREWVGLTDEERAWCGAPTLQETVARVEAKLKEKNT